MMKSKWGIMVFFCLVLIVLSQISPAAVTDPNIITAASRYTGTRVAPVVVNGGLVDGCLSFVDRTYGPADVGDLEGIDYVMTSMDGRDSANEDTWYVVTLDKPGRLFLIIDNRVGDSVDTNPPTLGQGKMNWVVADGFVQTTYVMPSGWGAGEECTIYQKYVTAGSYTLKEQNDGTSRAAYGIAAAPDGWEFPNSRPLIQGIPASTQVAPGESLEINATITDDGLPDPPGTVTVEWTVEAAPDGATVTFSPDQFTEDVTIDFSDMGSYSLKIAATDSNMISEHFLEVTVQIPTFAVAASDHCMACNDALLGPDDTRRTTISDVRNYEDASTTRRRVGYYKYNISTLKPPGKVFANCYLTLNVDKGTSGKNCYVYAINEDLDGITLEGGTWNTLPGVVNTPAPARGSEITVDTLDQADISPLVMSFPRPATLAIWTSTSPSAGLDEILNADTDGNIILMFITYDPQNSDFEICSPSHSRTDPETGLKGIILRGNIMSQTWATEPNPADNSTAGINLAQLSWTKPAPSEEGATVTSNVYFGTTEPNMTDPDYGLDTLATGISDNFVSLSSYLPLDRDTVYYWVVDSVDSETGLSRGYAWNFNTNNLAPSVDAGPDQYLWLDPTSATAYLNGEVSDDGQPDPPGAYTVKWQQIAGPVTVATEPNDLEDITVVLPAVGLYTFSLTADDGDLTDSDTVDVFVGATPCDAAKAKPDYVQINADFDNDCYVDLNDLGEFALHWLECNVSMDASCN